MEFCVKPIHFLGRPCVIICQNQNGPCPLLAIANILLLQDKISISSDISIISLAELTQIVANAILEKIGQSSLPEHVKLVESVLNILPKLARGLDLNVIFSGVNKFEFTEEISVFDALGIQLLHGWICDPNDIPASALIGNLSYNHLIFRLVEYKSLSLERKEAEAEDNAAGLSIGGESEEPDSNSAKVEPKKDIHELRREGALIEKFLADTAGQFTYPGMLALYSTMQDRQFAVFFRNNHFSTMYFYNGQLFTLITDLGYLQEPSVVWELLDHIDGNSEFYNELFEPLASAQSPGFAERHLQEFAALASSSATSTMQSTGSSPSSPTSATAGGSNGGTIAAPPLARKASGVPTICAPPSARTVEKKSDIVTEKEAEKQVVDGDAPDLPLAPPASSVPATNTAANSAGTPSVDAKDGTVEASLSASTVLVSSTDGADPSADSTILIVPPSSSSEPSAVSIDDSYELVDHHHAAESTEGSETTTLPPAEGTGETPAVPIDESVSREVISSAVTEPAQEVIMNVHKADTAAPKDTPEPSTVAPSQDAAPEAAIDPDLLFAMQLQEEEDRLAAQHQAHNLARQAGMPASSSSSSHTTSTPGPVLSQEESDREHALMLHYQDLQEAEQQRGAQSTSSSAGSVPPTRYTTYAASGSGSFPYNRQQERPPQNRAKDKNCVIS
eukprot:gene11814-13709_t